MGAPGALWQPPKTAPERTSRRHLSSQCAPCIPARHRLRKVLQSKMCSLTVATCSSAAAVRTSSISSTNDCGVARLFNSSCSWASPGAARCWLTADGVGYNLAAAQVKQSVHAVTDVKPPAAACLELITVTCPTRPLQVLPFVIRPCVWSSCFGTDCAASSSADAVLSLHELWLGGCGVMVVLLVVLIGMVLLDMPDIRWLHLSW